MNYKEILTNIIEKHVPNANMYLFGSRAKGTHKTGSDIDIALDNGSAIDWAIMGALREDIDNSDLILFVDIVDIHDVAEDIKKEIQKDGILWTKKH